MMVAAVAAAIERRPMLLFATVLLACLGKETLGPFVLVLVLVCARSEDDRWLPRRALTDCRRRGSRVGDDAFGGVQRVPLRRGSQPPLPRPSPAHRGCRAQGRSTSVLSGCRRRPASCGVWPVVIALGAGRRRLDHPQHAPWHGHHSRLASPAGGDGAHGRVRRRVDVLVLTVRVASRSVRRLAVRILPAATIALLHTTGEGLIEWVVGGRLRAVLIAAVATVASIPQYRRAVAVVRRGAPTHLAQRVVPADDRVRHLRRSDHVLRMHQQHHVALASARTRRHPVPRVVGGGPGVGGGSCWLLPAAGHGAVAGDPVRSRDGARPRGASPIRSTRDQPPSSFRRPVPGWPLPGSTRSEAASPHSPTGWRTSKHGSTSTSRPCS